MMKKKGFCLKTVEGEYDLESHVTLIGRDLLVAIWGGEEPHIGAVSMAQPRPSLENPEKTSATASVFCFLGHKEDDLAKAVSESLAAALNCRVIVTAGIHWDNIDSAGIQAVNRNSKILAEMILDTMAAICPPS